MPPGPDIFVSYASADAGRVRVVVDRVAAAGVRVWRDETHILGGRNYGPEIARAIRSSRVLMLMCSDAAMRSRNVKQEIQLAWRYEVPLLPVLLEPVEVSEELIFWLEGWQWVKVHGRPEEEWAQELLKGLTAAGVSRVGRLNPGLDGLWAAASFTDRITAVLATSGAASRRFRFGDPVKLVIDADHDADLVLLNRGPEGALYCLCPSAFAPTPAIRAGRTELPRPESPYPAFEIRGKAGREEILAVLAERPLGLDWLPAGPEAFEHPCRVLTDEDVDRLIRRLDEIGAGRWDALATWFDVSPRTDHFGVP